MEKSALQIARSAYQPKLPKALQGAVKIKEGKATQSVADQEAIKKLFPNTYGMPVVTFETASKAAELPAINVGVILSGGQAPGRSQCDFGYLRRTQEHEQELQALRFLGWPERFD